MYNNVIIYLMSCCSELYVAIKKKHALNKDDKCIPLDWFAILLVLWKKPYDMILHENHHLCFSSQIKFDIITLAYNALMLPMSNLWNMSHIWFKSA